MKLQRVLPQIVQLLPGLLEQDLESAGSKRARHAKEASSRSSLDPLGVKPLCALC